MVRKRRRCSKKSSRAPKRKASRSVERTVAASPEPVARVPLPELQHRAFLEAGHVIVAKLREAIGDELQAIRQSMVLLEVGLVGPPALRAVWGGVGNLPGKKADVLALVRKAGYEGLDESMTLADIRTRCHPVTYLSVENCALWRASGKEVIVNAIETNILPDEPLWMEKLMHSKDEFGRGQGPGELFCVAPTVLCEKLHLPAHLAVVMSCPWVYHRAKVAIFAAKKWREFNGLDDLNIEAIVDGDEQLQKSLRAEKSIRAEYNARVTTLRGVWKGVGADRDLDEVLEAGRLSDERYRVTADYITNGGDDRLKSATIALTEVKEWRIQDERVALKAKERVERHGQLSAGCADLCGGLPPELDPIKDGSTSGVHDVRTKRNISWEFIVGNPAVSLGDAIAAHQAIVEHGAHRATESAAVVLKGQVERYRQLQGVWSGRDWEGIDELNPILHGHEVGDASSAYGSPRWQFDVSWGFIAGNPAVSLDDAIAAHEGFIEHKGHRPTESKALVLMRQVERYRQLQGVWSGRDWEGIDELNPILHGAQPSGTKVRRLDTSLAYIKDGRATIDQATDHHDAFISFAPALGSDATESAAFARKIQQGSQIERYNMLRQSFKRLGMGMTAMELHALNPSPDGNAAPSAMGRTRLNTSWAFISDNVGSLDGSLAAHTAYNKYMNHRGTESDALVLEGQVERYKMLASAWSARGWGGIEKLDPLDVLPSGLSLYATYDLLATSNDPSVACLDASRDFIANGEITMEHAMEHHEAFMSRASVIGEGATESEAFALDAQLRRLEQVRDAWKSLGLDGGLELDVPMPAEIAKKYPVTTGYILGNFQGKSKDLGSAIEARVLMHTEGRSSEESISLEDCQRHPKEHHVYVCPCSWYGGRSKMASHLRKNEGNDVSNHAPGA